MNSGLKLNQVARQTVCLQDTEQRFIIAYNKYCGSFFQSMKRLGTKKIKKIT